MADLDFDQIPAQEQMVDNWGQPTPWMQALWQRLTGQIAAQIGELAAAQAALDAAQTALGAAQADILALEGWQTAAIISLDDIQDQIVAFDTDLALVALDLQGKINALDARLDTAEANISAIFATLAAHDGRLGNLEVLTANHESRLDAGGL